LSHCPEDAFLFSCFTNQSTPCLETSAKRKRVSHTIYEIKHTSTSILFSSVILHILHVDSGHMHFDDSICGTMYINNSRIIQASNITALQVYTTNTQAYNIQAGPLPRWWQMLRSRYCLVTYVSVHVIRTVRLRLLLYDLILREQDIMSTYVIYCLLHRWWQRC
jgi:hypothetical protein